MEAVREEAIPKHRVHIEVVGDNGELRRVQAIAIQCRQCEEPACAQACISGGIRVDEVSHCVGVDPAKCVGCWSCIMVCPYGAVVKDEENHRALKCDRCPDREIPACVASCITHALVYCEPDELEKELT